MTDFAVGDIQGCFSELKELLQLIKFNPQTDRLWLTGDLVNRGPQSLEVLRYVKSLGSKAIVVLGNHDLHFLAVAYGTSPIKPHDTFAELLAAPDCFELCDWLRQQHLFYFDSATGYALVHAGLPPQWTLHKALALSQEVETALKEKNFKDFFAHMYGDQPNKWDDSLTGWSRLRLIINYFTRLRFCDEQGTLDLSNKGSQPNKNHTHLIPWFKAPNRQHRELKIIFGHWAALKGKTDTPSVFGLDTGCAWGNKLTAMRLEDEQRFSILCDAHQKHRLPGSKNE